MDECRTQFKCANSSRRRVAILADLPSPKMRLGIVAGEPIHFHPGDRLTLTSDDIVGTAERVSMSFPRLPQVVKAGDRLFLIVASYKIQIEHYRKCAQRFRRPKDSLPPGVWRGLLSRRQPRLPS
jgi:pyruvate kinase